MAYIDPKLVLSPKARISKLKVIFDGGEEGISKDGYSIAEMEWDGEIRIGLRWNGSDQCEDASTVGNPQSRGLATWFILPSSFDDAARKIAAEREQQDQEDH